MTESVQTGKRIAIVEDEVDLAALLHYNLKREGFDPRVFDGAGNTLKALEQWKPALVLLDVMLPGADGFEICRQIRKSTALGSVPVLFLTARSDELDRVLGLEIGGDDYVTKPFSTREVVARLKAHLRRGELNSDSPVREMGPFRLDLVARRLFLLGREVTLTATEFNLLSFFFAHPGRAYSREQLLDSVWCERNCVTPRTVDVHIRRLRERIEEQPESPRYLTTVRGFGYRLEAPE